MATQILKAPAPVVLTGYAATPQATNDDGLRELITSVRQGMEVKAGYLASVRHHVENLLAAFALGLSNRDHDFLRELIKGVSIQMGDRPPADPAQAVSEVLRWSSPEGRNVIQTVGNISRHILGSVVRYRAVYQNWDQDTMPACISIGTYTGMLTSGPQTWKWTQHSGRSAGASGARLSPQTMEFPTDSSAHEKDWLLPRY